MGDASTDNGKPKPLSVNEGLGCLTIIVVFLVCTAVGAMFRDGTADTFKLLAAVALAALGFGVVFVCAKYRS